MNKIGKKRENEWKKNENRKELIKDVGMNVNMILENDFD